MQVQNVLTTAHCNSPAVPNVCYDLLMIGSHNNEPLVVNPNSLQMDWIHVCRAAYDTAGT